MATSQLSSSLVRSLSPSASIFPKNSARFLRCELSCNSDFLGQVKSLCKRNANNSFYGKKNTYVMASSGVQTSGSSLEEIKNSFEKEEVKIDSGLGGLTRVTLTNATGSSAEIYLYGGVVTSWKNSSGDDFLYVRPDAVFNGQKPISGGIPHCFPQFGPGEMQQHGFARNLDWDIVESKGGESPSVVLRLSESSYTRAMFDYAFENLFEITLDKANLLTKLTVKNNDEKEFSFTTALHTYFKASAADAKVQGLQNLKFLNKFPDPQNPIPGVEDREKVDFPGFVDCMYLNAPSEVSLINGYDQTVKISSQGWKDVVIWNPHLTMEACYKEFVCVENAQLDSVSLPAGQVWVAEQLLSVS